MLCFMLFLILINLLYGLNQPNIDNNGHIGGLIAGVLCGFWLLDMSAEGLKEVLGKDAKAKKKSKKMSFG